MYKKKLSEKIFDLVFHNVYASSVIALERALKNRFVGFRAELDLIKYLAIRGKALREGGYLVPTTSRSPTLSQPVYFTVDVLDVSLYEPLYKNISKIKFEKMLYIKALGTENFSNWKQSEIIANESLFPIPEFEIYEFRDNIFTKINNDIAVLINLFRPKEKRFVQQIKISTALKQYCISLIDEYDCDVLLHLYINRLVFDGFIGLNFYKGISSDIDGIITGKENKFVLVEIKEKDLSKTKPIGFGIDVQRLKDCMQISNETGLEYLYVVRHVNNQMERKFIEWKWVRFKKFNDCADHSKIKSGGVGMNTGQLYNPTVMLELKYFKPLLF